MIGIIQAEAVITSEILLLANTQEITLAHRFHDGTTYCLDSKSIDKVLCHVSRCLIYKVHSASRSFTPSLVTA